MARHGQWEDEQQLGLGIRNATCDFMENVHLASNRTFRESSRKNSGGGEWSKINGIRITASLVIIPEVECT